METANDRVDGADRRGGDRKDAKADAKKSHRLEGRTRHLAAQADRYPVTVAFSDQLAQHCQDRRRKRIVSAAETRVPAVAGKKKWPQTAAADADDADERQEH